MNMAFLFICVFFIFLHQCLIGFKWMTFTSLVTFIVRYFIFFFNVIVDGISFLNSLSDSLLLVYRKVRDFCILILFPKLYWIHLLFLMVLLVELLLLLLSVYSIIHLQIVRVLLFPSYLNIFYFSFMLTVSRPSNICSIEVMRMDNFVLFLILKEKLSAFHCWVLCQLWVCHEWVSLSWAVLLLYHLW